jgi:hypothetical protein
MMETTTSTTTTLTFQFLLNNSNREVTSGISSGSSQHEVLQNVQQKNGGTINEPSSC